MAQTLIRLTSPGVPDLYQGAEYWDLTLVDPDNRRPVDFAARRASLGGNEPAAELLAHWHDGRIKQRIIARALAFRSAQELLFADGSYEPLRVEGPACEHVVAFARALGKRACIVVVPRLSVPLLDPNGVLPLIPEPAWNDTYVMLPRTLADKPWSNVMTGERLQAGGNSLPVGKILGVLPVALMGAI